MAHRQLITIAAAIAGTEEDCLFEDADVVVLQVVRQPAGRNEEMRMRKGLDQLQQVWACLEVAR